MRAQGSHSSANPTIIPLPRIVARMQAAVMEHLPGRLLTRDNLDSMSVDSVCGCEFPNLFGFAPTPLDAVAHRFLGDALLRSRYRQFRFRARR
jgi:hypothetical protein